MLEVRGDQRLAREARDDVGLGCEHLLDRDDSSRARIAGAKAPGRGRRARARRGPRSERDRRCRIGGSTRSRSPRRPCDRRGAARAAAGMRARVAAWLRRRRAGRDVASGPVSGAAATVGSAPEIGAATVSSVPAGRFASANVPSSYRRVWRRGVSTGARRTRAQRFCGKPRSTPRWRGSGQREVTALVRV